MKEVDRRYIVKAHGANFYKSIFIDYYLNKENPELIANEVMYGLSQKVSDLVIMDKDKLISVEIKSDVDNLNRIVSQVEESKKNFDYVVIFTSKQHLAKIEELLPKDIGVFYYEDGSIVKVRRPLKQRQDSLELVYSLPVSFLKTYYRSRGRENCDDYRRRILRIGKRKIEEIRKAYILKKYKPAYQLFLNERGEITHEEDIPILSMGEITIL